ncbi:MAG: hypothetical protein KDD73_06960 [Anaerolineales bacterium]|nr:hypothetical protein [Anaerolineales bacterium]MCB9126481.1 hypothetical protein [Ardenticatenales bacterium]
MASTAVSTTAKAWLHSGTGRVARALSMIDDESQHLDASVPLLPPS